MTRDFERLGREIFDVLVVGGGIYGLAAAYDAAQRGLSVALIERDDFGGRTSFNHHKTIHGGLRHLQRANLKRLRESVRERRAFARIAPQFLVPQPFLVPTRRSLARGSLALRTALSIERALAFDRNRDLPAELALPPGRVVPPSELRRLVPGMDLEGVTGGAIWYDYKTEHSERLTLAFALAAARHGAVLVNYAEAVAACREGTQICGMRVRDGLTGDAALVRARITCNAAGASAGRLMAHFGLRRMFPLVKTMNVVTRRPAWPVAVGRPTRGGRLLIALPWHDRLAIGTWHGAEPAGADATAVEGDELAGFLAEINEAYPDLDLTMADVALVHRGVVPARLRRGRRPELLEHSRVLDHAREGVEGAISLVGVKYTTARLAAEHAVDAVRRKLELGPIPCRTASTPLIDADATLAAKAAGLAAAAPLYDRSAVARMIALIDGRPELGRPLAPDVQVTAAQVLEAVRHEMALSVEDVVLRRTGLGTVGYPGHAAVRAVAGLMQQELAWSSSRVDEEVESVRRYFETGPDQGPTLG
jgi:glycerol-3-phosphate dehydrogenase